jgi:hypothetical protein
MASKFTHLLRSYDYVEATARLVGPFAAVGGGAGFVLAATDEHQRRYATCAGYVAHCVVGTALGGATGAAAAIAHPLALVVPPAAIACLTRPASRPE